MGETAALSSGADLCHPPNPRQTAGAAIQTTSVRLEWQECRSAGILARIAPVGPNAPSMFCNVNTNRRGWVKRDVIRLGLVSRLIRKGTPRAGAGTDARGPKCHNTISFQP